MTQLTQKHITLPMQQQVAQTSPFVKPLSYEFRVAEHVDDGVVTRVGLQMQIWEHDEYGSGIVKSYWHDVPRVKIDSNGTLITP
jgi:hypothetical protein